jgi:hypothetical protein
MERNSPFQPGKRAHHYECAQKRAHHYFLFTEEALIFPTRWLESIRAGQNWESGNLVDHRIYVVN